MKEPVWSPLKFSVFRSFWICALLSHLGTWIQDVAASWVLTHLSTSPLVISLLSFTNSLPILLLSIPAGYIADIGYRRKMLLGAQVIMFVAAGTMALVTWSGEMSSSILLGLSLLMAIGSAMTSPPLQSVLTDLVPTSSQAQAVLIYYMGINITRVVGPTIGGGVLSFFGPEVAFVLNSVSYFGLMIFFWKWPVRELAKDKNALVLRSEDWLSLFSKDNLRHWLEIFCVTFFASALWALYPTKGRIELHLNSWQYGSLLGCLGLGACISALLSDRIMNPAHTKRSLAGAYIVYAAGLFVMGVGSHFALLCIAMLLGGMGWLVLATLMNVSSRILTGDSHLKATMLGVFLSVFYAGMALGAVTWGGIARLGHTSGALVLASVGLSILGFSKGLRAIYR